MRTITTTTKILKYNELTKSAKSTARSGYASSEGYLHAEEAMESIRKLAEHFNGTVTTYEIDWSGGCCHSTMSFDMPHESNMDESEIQSRLETLGDFNPETLKGLGDCELTGVCYDEDAIDGFRKKWHEGERDIAKLMEAAFRSLLAQCHSEYESFYGDDDSEFADYCEANNVEFYEDGSPF